MATLEDLQTMLSVDGYSLAVDTADGKTKAVITAGEGVCGDCLVPKPVLAGLLSQALDVPADTIAIEYPEEEH